MHREPASEDAASLPAQTPSSPAPRSLRGGARRRLLAPVTWVLLVIAAIGVPLRILWTAPESSHQGFWRVTSLVAALAAASLLLLTFVLPSRFRPITGYLGVERLLRSHRALALIVVGLVLAHVVAVLLRPGPGLGASSTCAPPHPACGPRASRRWRSSVS